MIVESNSLGDGFSRNFYLLLNVALYKEVRFGTAEVTIVYMKIVSIIFKDTTSGIEILGYRLGSFIHKVEEEMFVINRLKTNVEKGGPEMFRTTHGIS